ncbi:flippase [Enterococcus faecium]|nr:flippase [Enterococcus faecium]MCV3177103.1 flippase [Enterococcus faecium]MCV3182154.1 flippase [Enterococcus faecium]MCV3184866.1 flippase [Enterococcus faecium]MCV3189934.1 flippase [Enterococcus faecium]MCW0078874.1 flippase [Enterococcus faecium]
MQANFLKKYSKVIENFFSLASVQLLNYILPLLTLPFLTRKLGVGMYGLISFSQAIIQYFILITEFGFGLTGARDISQNREDKEKTSEILLSIIFAKLLLLIICFFVLVLILVAVPKFGKEWQLYILTFGMVLGSVIFPSFYFQGIEEMKVTAILNFISKILFTIGIFVFVKSKDDYLLVPIFNSLGAIFSGIISVVLLFKQYKVRFVQPPLSSIKHQIIEAYPLFVSNVFSSIYTTSSIVVLGLFSNNVTVGYYSAADKIIKACSNMISPIIQVVYPRMSFLIKKDGVKAINYIRKLAFYSSLIVGSGSLILLFLSPYIMPLFFGSKYDKSILLIRIMSFIPLIILWAKILGSLVLINFGKQKDLSKVYLITGICSIITTFTLIPILHDVGTALNTLIIESVATSGIIYTVFKNVETKQIFFIKENDYNEE